MGLGNFCLLRITGILGMLQGATGHARIWWFYPKLTVSLYGTGIHWQDLGSDTLPHPLVGEGIQHPPPSSRIQPQPPPACRTQGVSVIPPGIWDLVSSPVPRQDPKSVPVLPPVGISPHPSLPSGRSRPVLHLLADPTLLLAFPLPRDPSGIPPGSLPNEAQNLRIDNSRQTQSQHPARSQEPPQPQGSSKSSFWNEKWGKGNKLGGRGGRHSAEPQFLRI